MPIYENKGTLTGTIEPENVSEAQRYLQFNHDLTPADMEQYLDPPLKGVIDSLMWHLDHDGHHYRVVAFANRELSDAELEQLAGEVSGQNSDGLGEGFEQQGFAETGEEWDEDEETSTMISFDWKTNDSKFTRVK